MSSSLFSHTCYQFWLRRGWEKWRSLTCVCVCVFQNLESVSDGPCRECQCRDGHVTCYQHSCPTCPVGTLAMPQQGQCCPECHPGEMCVCVYVWRWCRKMIKLSTFLNASSYSSSRNLSQSQDTNEPSSFLVIWLELESVNTWWLTLKQK